MKQVQGSVPKAQNKKRLLVKTKFIEKPMVPLPSNSMLLRETIPIPSKRHVRGEIDWLGLVFASRKCCVGRRRDVRCGLSVTEVKINLE